MPDDLLRYRSESPIVETSTYLISNSLGAMPRGVYDALHQYADTWATVRRMRFWRACGQWRSRRSVERKIFWTSFILLSLIADFSLPLLWALVATIPIAFASWWIAYRSGWF